MSKTTQKAPEDKQKPSASSSTGKKGGARLDELLVALASLTEAEAMKLARVAAALHGHVVVPMQIVTPAPVTVQQPETPQQNKSAKTSSASQSQPHAKGNKPEIQAQEPAVVFPKDYPKGAPRTVRGLEHFRAGLRWNGKSWVQKPGTVTSSQPNESDGSLATAKARYSRAASLLDAATDAHLKDKLPLVVRVLNAAAQVKSRGGSYSPRDSLMEVLEGIGVLDVNGLSAQELEKGEAVTLLSTPEGLKTLAKRVGNCLDMIMSAITPGPTPKSN